MGAFYATNKDDGSCASLSLSATTSAQLATLPVSKGNNLRVQTEVGSAVFIRFGTSSVVATTADGGWDYIIPGGIVETLAIASADTHMSYLVASGTNTIRLSRGEGI